MVEEVEDFRDELCMDLIVGGFDAITAIDIVNDLIADATTQGVPFGELEEAVKRSTDDAIITLGFMEGVIGDSLTNGDSYPNMK